MRNSRALLLILPFLLFCHNSAVAQASNAAPAPTQRSCHIVTSPPTPGESLLAAGDDAAAEKLYREALTHDPHDPESEFGLVRSLIGLDRPKEALDAAQTMAANQPGALAEVALSEAAYRAADLPGALQHAIKAEHLDLCEGRAHFAFASISQINANYHTAWLTTRTAHQLRPNDEIIRRAWFDYLPRQQRVEQLEAYLATSTHLDKDERHDLDNELQHLRTHHAGECRITSAADTVTAPLQLLFGESTRPIAFGLDVKFDGKNRRMQIDTGASGIVLTQSAARGLGLQPELETKTFGIGDEGANKSFLTHVKSIRIGDVELTDCTVEVLGKSKLGTDGLIGMDVFEKWLVTLDYQDAKLHLQPLPPRPGDAAKPAGTQDDPELVDGGERFHDRYIDPSMKDFDRVIRIGHQILLPADLHRGEGPLHYLLMDTGASQSELSPEFVREGGKIHTENFVQIYGISGEVKKVYYSDRLDLRVANLLLPSEEYLSFNAGLSHSNDFEIAGLLGLPTLQRLTISIDYRDNLVKLSWDPKRDRIRF